MYFAIEGVIGVGKTTLARMLQPLFQANLLLEIFEENPFLSDFYSDRGRYAFQTQIFFLLSRYHQQRQGIPQLLSEGLHIISDYTFDKDSLFAHINLKSDELEIYSQVHEALGEKIIIPDLVVYLQAETDVLMHRIVLRDRSYERQMEWDYINDLNRAYDDFFLHSTARHSSILAIDTNQMDFVQSSEALDWIENRIRQTLQLPPFQPELPLPSQDSEQHSSATQ